MQFICHLSNGESIFEDRDGKILIEKDYMYLMDPSPEELEEAHKIIELEKGRENVI